MTSGKKPMFLCEGFRDERITKEEEEKKKSTIREKIS